MNRCGMFVLIAGALCSTLSLAQAASATAMGLSVSADRIIVAPKVRLPERTGGDLIAAGGRVEVAAPVDGDTALAGGELRVSASLARNVYVAGGRVQLHGEMGRNLRAAGGQIELGSSARVAGHATIAAGDVSVGGPIKGSLSIMGGRALIDSTVDGDVTVTAGQIELGPHVRIGGALRWRSQGELQRHASAQVAGPIERLEPMPRREGAAGRPIESRHAIGWLAGTWWTVGLMIVAAVLLAAVPGLASEVAQTWRERAGTSQLAGFVSLVCIPVAVVILFCHGDRRAPRLARTLAVLRAAADGLREQRDWAGPIGAGPLEVGCCGTSRLAHRRYIPRPGSACAAGRSALARRSGGAGRAADRSGRDRAAVLAKQGVCTGLMPRRAAVQPPVVRIRGAAWLWQP